MISPQEKEQCQTNQLSYAGAALYKSRFTPFIKSSPDGRARRS
jgi:hypothetical protein